MYVTIGIMVLATIAIAAVLNKRLAETKKKA